MGTVSARVPEELEAALEEYAAAENVERSTAIRQLLADGLESRHSGVKQRSRSPAPQCQSPLIRFSSRSSILDSALTVL